MSMVTNTRSSAGAAASRVTETCWRYTLEALTFCTSRGAAASRTPSVGFTAIRRLEPATRGTAARCKVTGWSGITAPSKR
jgi:hypothetical protein